jgi:phospholipase/carboxylesterase
LLISALAQTPDLPAIFGLDVSMGSSVLVELETIEVETGDDPVAAIIWLHGLGADAHDFEPVVPAVSLGKEYPVRYVFPNAPTRPVTVNGGALMRAWFDVLALNRDAPEDEPGIRESATFVEQLIERETERGIEPARILLAGFSQGGAVALFTALRYSKSLAGVIALSTYLPLPEILSQEKNPANDEIPIFMAHGQFDNMVDINFARSSRKRLVETGYSVNWQEYPMLHSVIPEELSDIKAFLSAVLAKL